MSNAQKCFRTLTRIGIYRLANVSGTLTLLPISLATPPQSISITPGDSVEEPTEIAQDGRQVISFAYSKESKPELALEFALSTAEAEALVHGKLVVSSTTAQGFVYAEIQPSTYPSGAVPARAIGQIGYDVVAQTATQLTPTNLIKPYGHYIDPVSKLAVPLTVIDSTQTGPLTTGQIQIGAHMAITLSADLVTANNTLFVWVPCTFTKASIISSQTLEPLRIFAQGISFDNTVRDYTFWNCSRLPGGSLGPDSKRSVKLRINADPASTSGLGFDMQDTPLINVY